MLKFGNTGKLYKIVKSAYDKNRYSITPFPPNFSSSRPPLLLILPPLLNPLLLALNCSEQLTAFQGKTQSKSCNPENAQYIQTDVCRSFHFNPVFPCKTPHSTKWYD